MCEFFTGRNVKENFYAGDVVPMEAFHIQKRLKRANI